MPEPSITRMGYQAGIKVVSSFCLRADKKQIHDMSDGVLVSCMIE